MHFKRGPRPGAIKHRVAGLASEHFGADFRLAIVLLIEGQPLPRLQLVRSRSLHLRVETRNQNFALRVFELADDFNQREERIGRRPAVHAGVQVSLRAVSLDLRVHQSSQTDA